MIHHIIYILNIMHDNIIYPFFSQLKSSRQFTCWSLWRRSTLGCTPCPHWSWRRDLRKKSVGLGKFMEILKWNVKKTVETRNFVSSVRWCFWSRYIWVGLKPPAVWHRDLVLFEVFLHAHTVGCDLWQSGLNATTKTGCVFQVWK
jgi:hypothetical protein